MLRAMSPAGFYNVPVTKFLTLFVGSCSILAAIFKVQPQCHFQISPHMTVHHQFWRLFTSHWAFSSSSDVLFGTILLYCMRIIERQFGSAKYASFVVVVLALSTMLEIAALVTGAGLGLRSFPGGPFALIFATLYQYHRLVPVTYRFRIFGVTFSNKSFIYMIALQLFLSQSLATIVPCTCGLLAGAIYRSDITNLKLWRLPRRLQVLASRLVGPLLSSPPMARSVNTWPNQNLSVSFAVENLVQSASALRHQRTETDRTGTGAASSVQEYIDTLTGSADAPEPPSAEHLASLETMFPDHPREVIIRALTSAGNDLNRAAEIMLSMPAPASEPSAEGSSSH